MVSKRIWTLFWKDHQCTCRLPHQIQPYQTQDSRVLFDPENAHSGDLGNFSNHDNDRIFPGFFNEVLEALQKSYVEFGPLLSITYNFRNPMASDLITNLRDTWTEYLEEAGDNLDQLKGIQYFYGFLKDLALAYEEFRSNAMEIEGICCADSSLFPTPDLGKPSF